MKLAAAAAQIFPQFNPNRPNFPPPPQPVGFRRRPVPPIPLKSYQSQTPNPETIDGDGIPVHDVKVLARFKSRHNFIRVLQVSRAADHPLAGARLLLLDSPGNIHSISFLFKSLTNAYFDVLATLPPILPAGPVGILGFGAGSAARIILEHYPDITVHGYELDPAVLAVAREYFGLDEIERKYSDRLQIHTGNALSCETAGGFAGLAVDLFSRGRVIPELQDAAAWEKLKRSLRRGGRIMANVGGSCVEPEDRRTDGGAVMAATLSAMWEVFPGEIHVVRLQDRKDESAVALTGGLPDVGKWKAALKRPLKFYVDMLEPYRRF